MLEYEPKSTPNFWGALMRIRVLVDVRQPLKRSKKIKKQGVEAITSMFKYERLDNFCYLCGCLGHMEGFCAQLFNLGFDDGSRGLGPRLKAEVRRDSNSPRSKWLRKKGQSKWSGPTGRVTGAYGNFGGSVGNNQGLHGKVGTRGEQLNEGGSGSKKTERQLQQR